MRVSAKRAIVRGTYETIKTASLKQATAIHALELTVVS